MDNKYFHNEKKIMTKNRLIRRRRIFFLRRMVFIFLIFVIFILVLVNSPIFNIKYLKITGNKILPEEYVRQELNNIFHKNILFYSFDSEFNSLRENKYVKHINYKREYPNTLKVYLDEVNVDYYIYHNNEYYIFDRESKLVDILDYKQNFDIIEIMGIDIPDDFDIGKKLFDSDSRELQWMKNLSDLLDLNQSNIKFDSIYLEDIHNLVLGYNDLKIKIGNNSDLREKLNNAINIINSNLNFKDMIGYIDVRSKNYPVIMLEEY